MSRYAISGFTQEEVAQGKFLEFMRVYSEAGNKEDIDVMEKVRKGFKFKKEELLILAVTHIQSGQLKTYGEYFDYLLINEIAEIFLTDHQISYRHLGYIDIEDIPRNYAILIRSFRFLPE